jgi:hypothetical protein
VSADAEGHGLTPACQDVHSSWHGTSQSPEQGQEDLVSSKAQEQSPWERRHRRELLLGQNEWNGRRSCGDHDPARLRTCLPHVGGNLCFVVTPGYFLISVGRGREAAGRRWCGRSTPSTGHGLSTGDGSLLRSALTVLLSALSSGRARARGRRVTLRHLIVLTKPVVLKY